MPHLVPKIEELWKDIAGGGGFLILENKIELTCILHMTVFLDICNEVDNSGSCSQDEV